MTLKQRKQKNREKRKRQAAKRDNPAWAQRLGSTDRLLPGWRPSTKYVKHC